MVDILIPFLSFIAVLALGGAVLTAAAARRHVVQQRLSRLSEQATAAAPLSESSFFLRFLSRIGKMVSSKEPSISLREQLARAGYHHDSAPAIYLGSKMLLLLVGMIGLAVVVLPIEKLMFPVRALIILWGSGVVFLLPNLAVSRRRAQRRKKIANHLPDAIDLLEICVSAGMGLDTAWNAVSD